MEERDLSDCEDVINWVPPVVTRIVHPSVKRKKRPLMQNTKAKQNEPM